MKGAHKTKAISEQGFETHTEKNVAQSATEFKFANLVCGAGQGGV